MGRTIFTNANMLDTEYQNILAVMRQGTLWIDNLAEAPRPAEQALASA
jgi:hypothetical protein